MFLLYKRAVNVYVNINLIEHDFIRLTVLIDLNCICQIGLQGNKAVLAWIGRFS